MEISQKNNAKRIAGYLCAIIATIVTVVGIPLALLIWLEGAMTTVPRFTADHLKTALPLPILAWVFAGAALFLLRRQQLKRPHRTWLIVVMVVSTLTSLLLVSTYFDNEVPRFLPAEPPKTQIRR